MEKSRVYPRSSLDDLSLESLIQGDEMQWAVPDTFHI
jgi:hypothetical protein